MYKYAYVYAYMYAYKWTKKSQEKELASSNIPQISKETDLNPCYDTTKVNKLYTNHYQQTPKIFHCIKKKKKEDGLFICNTTNC